MRQIVQLLEITRQLKIAVMNEESNDRENKITDITAYVEKREKILRTIDPDLLSIDEKSMLKEIHDISTEVVNSMMKIKKSIQEEIVSAKKGKTAFKGYNQAYTSSFIDGHYIDKKK